MAHLLEGLEVGGGSYWYFSLWVKGQRMTGGEVLHRTINMGIPTGEYELIGYARMIAYRPLVYWSEE